MNLTNSDSSFLGRREMARSALLGGASFFLGAQGSAGGEGPAVRPERISLREFGATGDGKTDDTMAIQRALDAAGEVQGAVFVPPGVYLCADLQMRLNTALVGVPTWNYRQPGGTVLRLSSAAAKCLLNIAGAAGATIDGLAFDGGGLGKGVHGIFLDKPDYGKHEDEIGAYTGAPQDHALAAPVKSCDRSMLENPNEPVREIDGK
jgi:hypothetical protein